jgi:hypothetical protein
MVREVDEAVANSTYTQGRVSCIADTFVQAESSVPRINFSAKKPALRVGANRYEQEPENPTSYLGEIGQI